MNRARDTHHTAEIVAVKVGRRGHLTQPVQPKAGGNIAARPLDVARFTHAVFTEELLTNASIFDMIAFHPLTDGFAVGALAYGLGIEGINSGGKMLPMVTCGLVNYGHSGLDYGSGGVVNAYFPELKLGVSIAMTSALQYGAATCGKNCSISYEALPKISEYVIDDVLATLSVAAGLAPRCAAPSYAPLPPAACEDAPSFGTLNGDPVCIYI